ncbi:MAG: alpha/beta hydrolase [Candidatus Dormibacteria bacterium]
MRTDPRRVLASLSVAALLLFLGGPAAPASEATAASSPSPLAGSGPSSTPPGLVPAACSETPPPGAHCDTLWVPLDYSKPSLGTIPTAVVVVPATDPAERIGSLLVNPGGPGESGVEFVDEAYPLFATLNQRFDIVGFDPRGSTGPDAVTCDGTDGLDHDVNLDPMIAGSPTAEADLVATTLAFDDSCRLHSGWLLPYLGTAYAARDMDALRAALGDPELTYLGFSYGTALGATYASLFPTHIRAMVLDGDVDPALSFLEQSVQQGASFEASYGEFVSQCQAEIGCPLGSDPGTTIGGLLARLAERPVETPDGRTVGRGTVIGALVAAMYDPGSWGGFYAALAEAAKGQVASLQSLVDGYNGRGPQGYDHSTPANAAVNCADHSVPDNLADYDATALSVQAAEPHFGQDEVYSALTCAYWPVHGPAPAALDVTGAPPILLVGATHDPATPYSWSVALQQQIAGSVLLTRDGYGHTSYEFSDCVQTAVNAYLDYLSVPVAGTTCAS